MANPTKHTYRYAEHNPLVESGGPTILYDDGTTAAGRAARRPEGGSRGLVSRHPGESVLTAFVAGFLAAWWLAPRS
jgi:hypothetical protein